MSIPKILHFFAPEDENDWQDKWKYCLNSWKKFFPDHEYQYIFWNDDEINNFVKEKFPHYYEVYSEFPYHIMQLDFARYCVLYFYGGIYSDLDVECKNNFYGNLKGNFFVYGNETMIYEKNCLMVSVKENHFLLSVMENTINLYYEILYPLKRELVFRCGPLMLDNMMKNSGVVNKNIDIEFATHHKTGCWGKEDIKFLKNNRINT